VGVEGLNHSKKSGEERSGHNSISGVLATSNFWVVATQIVFIFTPKIGEDLPIWLIIGMI